MKKLLLAVTAVICMMTCPLIAKAPDNAINGKWHFVLATPGGDREMDAVFAADAGGNVTGTFDKSNAAGTYKDGHLAMNFEMTSEESGETAPLKLDGKMDDSGALSGTWAFSSYDGTFKAAHPKQ
jgi:hypothetical protein